MINSCLLFISYYIYCGSQVLYFSPLQLYSHGNFSEEGFPDPTPPASSESKPTVKKWEKPRNRAGEKPPPRKRGKGARKVKSYTVGEGQFKVNNQQEEKELVRRKRSHVCITTHCIAY